MKKQSLRVSLSCFFWLISLSIYAQTGTVKGVMTDSAQALPLLGAEIRINDLEGNLITGAATDFVDGAYEIELNVGTYEMVCSYMGYMTFSEQITIEKNNVLVKNINMKEEVNILKIVTKTASRFETPVGKSSISLDVVKPTLVDNTNATKVDEVVDKVPGVTVVDGQANIRGGSGYSYGAGSRVLLLVDDLPFLTGDAGQPNWRDIPVENIDQIEVVKGAASALYGSSALNGIINIRTAYAKKKPFTKISLFQTSFMTPARAETAWWNRDGIEVWDAATNPASDPDTVAPMLFAGRNGYRKPVALGVQFAHRRQINKFDLTLGGNYYYEDSYRAGSYERKFRVNSNMRYRFTPKFNVGANVNLNVGESGNFFLWNNEGISLRGFRGQEISTRMYEPFPGSITESQTSRFNIDPFLTLYDEKEGRHRLQTRYYYVNNNNGQNQSNQSHLIFGEYQYQRKFKLNSASLGDFKLVAGGVGNYTYSASQLFGNAIYHVSNGGLYVQGEQGFFKEKNDNTRLNITFGVRWEVFNINSPDSIQTDPREPQLIANPEVNSIDSTGIPRPRFRIGLNYEITPFTFLRASWGEGYRYPTIAERYIATEIGSGTTSLAILANPQLRPEAGWSAEIGIKQGFKIGNWKGFADLSGFWTEYQSMMEFTFGGGDPGATSLTNLFFQSVNIDDTRIRGFEFSLMGTGNVGPVSFNVLSGYTFIDPQFKNWDNNATIRELSTATFNILKYRSVHSVKFDIEAFMLKDKALSVGLYFNYNSETANIDRAFEDLLADVEGTDDIFGISYYRREFNRGEMFDLGARIGYRYSFKNSDEVEVAAVKLSLVGKNLLNQEYMIRPAFIAAPMNITVRLDVEF